MAIRVSRIGTWQNTDAYGGVRIFAQELLGQKLTASNRHDIIVLAVKKSYWCFGNPSTFLGEWKKRVFG